jgi:hypothetical protein
MKRIMIVVFALLVSIALGSAVIGEENKAKGKPIVGGDMPEKGKTKAGVKKFAGKVVSFDAAAKTLVAKREKTEMTFEVANAKLASNTKLDDFKVDDKIAIKYVEKDGKYLATSLAKAPAKEKK